MFSVTFYKTRTTKHSFFSSYLRFDVDTTELHSWMTRSEAVLQSSEFAIYRKEGNLSDLREKVNVRGKIYLLNLYNACRTSMLSASNLINGCRLISGLKYIDKVCINALML